MTVYDPQAVEARWQSAWAERGTFRTPNPGDPGFDPSRPKYYVLAMFPYPSGAGMHMGHALNYTSTDIVARYKRHRGFNVLHPIGYDAFGLPAEQYAVEHGVHPAVTTRQNIETISRQLRRLGLSFDWDRCLATTDPGYYKWTQWVFLQLYHSYFDPAEGKAKPIAALVRRLESGELVVGLDGELIPVAASGAMALYGGVEAGARKWGELDPRQQEALLAEYRLAYIAEAPVNWCPALGTVLANEEVTHEGRSERGNHPVYKRPLRQWMLRITAYADRLLEDLEGVDWPEPIKLMQRNWIGRSEGAVVDFAVDGSDASIRVFTTRPDTLFGVTYVVLAPEHPLVEEITAAEQRAAVEEYRRQAAAKTDVDRQTEAKQKTGVLTGGYAINPVNGQRVPIWIADYVMMGYGTGAIMAVPAHDERDYAFATTFNLPIVEVVRQGDFSRPVPPGAFTGDGVNINSSNNEISLDGLPTPEAKQKITRWLERKGMGRGRVQYKLRDWLFSRQRYWGEPFPILHAADGRTVPLDERELPVVLPEMEDFTPEASDDPAAPPRPPLGRAPRSWRIVERDGVRYERELNTMPQWAGSCWYYLRFLDPRNEQRFVDERSERYWMQPPRNTERATRNAPPGVDLYIGGVEHAVLHLLYARFWHKVLFDLGHVSTPEPFGRLFNQGYVQAAAYTDSRGVYVPADEVEERGGRYFYRDEPVTREFGKMGKSLKNSVSPDAVCAGHGADTLRLYLMYMGPLDASKPWEARDIAGPSRFLHRVWRNFIDAETGRLLVTDDPPTEPRLRLLHKTIERVTGDMERLAFNTAIAALIELNNELVGSPSLPRAVAEPLLVMLSPLAPHIAEELWHKIGHETSITDEPWPGYDERYTVDATVEVAVQVMGKVRGRITVPADADSKAVEAAALADEKIAHQLAGKTVRKVIVVPGKLVNIVAN